MRDIDANVNVKTRLTSVTLPARSSKRNLSKSSQSPREHDTYMYITVKMCPHANSPITIVADINSLTSFPDVDLQLIAVMMMYIYYLYTSAHALVGVGLEPGA